MHAHITIVTLGVSDLSRAIEFYQQGLKLPRSNDGDQIAFFDMSGVRLALYPRVALAEDVGVSADGSGFSGITLAHNVSSPEQVDAVLAEAVACGATLVKPGQKVFWGGYSGYFADPDGHLWEVAWAPGD